MMIGEYEAVIGSRQSEAFQTKKSEGINAGFGY